MPARKKTRRAAKPAARRPAKKKAGRRPAKKNVGRVAPKGRKAKAPARTPSRKPARAPARPAPTPAPANAIGFLTQHMDYTTHDLDAVRRFYVETLGFGEADHDPNFNYLWVRTGSSSSLGFMPPMPGMGMPSPVKEPTLYLLVRDVDRVYAELSLKGVHFEGPPADMPWGHRVVATMDPEGRRVLLATPSSSNS